MCTVNNAGELEKTVCPNLKRVAATISVDRLLDLPFCVSAWSLRRVIDEAAIMATNMAETFD